MSQYAPFHAGRFLIESTKNDINPSLMALFTVEDKVVEPISLHEWEDNWNGCREEWKPKCMAVAYSCSAREMVDRMDLLGFTSEVARQAFDIGRNNELKRLAAQISKLGSDLRHCPEGPVASVSEEAHDDARSHSERRFLNHTKKAGMRLKYSYC